MPGAANIRETKIGFSFNKQTDLVTPQTASGMVSLTKVNASLIENPFNTEDDAQDIGKGNEFPANNYPTNWDVRGPLEKYLSSQGAALFWAYALGKVVVTTPASGAVQYVMTPQDPVADGIDMKSFTFVEQIRPGGSAILDKAYVGCCMEEAGVHLQSGPGRANAKLTGSLAGTGQIVTPSTITLPATLVENLLKAGGASINILGTNYITAKSLVSIDVDWKNNIRLDSGFFPGSGTANGADIRGRMELGDRIATAKFVARFTSGSTEVTNLLAQTEGTAVITIQGALITGSTFHSLSFSFPRVRMSSAVVNDTNGIVTVACELKPLFDATNGYVTVTVITTLAGVLQ